VEVNRGAERQRQTGEKEVQRGTQENYVTTGKKKQGKESLKYLKRKNGHEKKSKKE